MNINGLFLQVEALRKAVVGRPLWVEEKGAFEYAEQSAKVVAALKLVRAAHGVSTISRLCQSGLFIDAGAIMRCIFDCEYEINFLLETYPACSTHVDQFVKAFFENTIDGYLEVETHPVPTRKVRSAVVRVLKGRNDDELQKRMERIYMAFSGYVHANYAHIMEVYNGGQDSFNLTGVPSQTEIARKMQYVEVAAESVRLAAAFIAQKLDMRDSFNQLMAL